MYFCGTGQVLDTFDKSSWRNLSALSFLSGQFLRICSTKSFNHALLFFFFPSVRPWNDESPMCVSIHSEIKAPSLISGCFGSVAKVTVNLAKVQDELTNLLRRPSDCLVSIIPQQGGTAILKAKLASNLRAGERLNPRLFCRASRSWKYTCCSSRLKSNLKLNPLFWGSEFCVQSLYYNILVLCSLQQKFSFIFQ